MNKEKWTARALELGFESFEIYQRITEERNVSWYEGQMDTFVTSRVTGTALRGVYHGKMANYATEDESDLQMEQVLHAMMQQAGAITAKDAALIRQPADAAPLTGEKHWVRPESAQINDLLKSLEEKILAYDARITMVTFLEWSEEHTRREITNSYGMQVEDESRAQLLAAGAAAVDGNDVKNDYVFRVIPDITALDADTLVRELCEKVLRKLGAKSLPSGSHPVILEKDAMTQLFQAFSGLWSGDLIAKGISPLRDKIGEQIFSDKITVIDDPRSPDALNSLRYDDEGCPTTRKEVVERGIFRTILHSTKSAAKMGAQSTGNGFKPSYAGAVDVSPYNCCIVPGEKSLDQLCADMGDGLVITTLQGLHAGIDFVTTNFSLQCAGYTVKNGKYDRSVSLITVAANFLELMKTVTAVGNDLEWSYHTIACPSIAFRSCAISGE